MKKCPWVRNIYILSCKGRERKKGRQIQPTTRRKRRRTSRTSSLGRLQLIKHLAQCMAHVKSPHIDNAISSQTLPAYLAGWALTLHPKSFHFSNWRSACLHNSSGHRACGFFSQQSQLTTWSLLGCLLAWPPLCPLGAWLSPGHWAPACSLPGHSSLSHSLQALLAETSSLLGPQPLLSFPALRTVTQKAYLKLRGKKREFVKSGR